MFRKIAVPVLLLLSLSACGYSPGHRAATGGLIGAGVGAGAGALLGVNPLVGAAVGAGAGAIGGAATAPHHQG